MEKANKITMSPAHLLLIIFMCMFFGCMICFTIYTLRDINKERSEIAVRPKKTTSDSVGMDSVRIIHIVDTVIVPINDWVYDPVLITNCSFEYGGYIVTLKKGKDRLYDSLFWAGAQYGSRQEIKNIHENEYIGYLYNMRAGLKYFVLDSSDLTQYHYMELMDIPSRYNHVFDSLMKRNGGCMNYFNNKKPNDTIIGYISSLGWSQGKHISKK